MIKTFAITSTITALWQSPVIALLILIALVFIADLLNRYLESKKITCVAPSSHRRMRCKATDWNAYSYRDIQAYAKLHGIKANKKRALLINSLQSKYNY